MSVDDADTSQDLDPFLPPTCGSELVELFYHLHQIRLPRETCLTPTVEPRKGSFRIRARTKAATTSFGKGTKQQFLQKVKLFFTREEIFWNKYFQHSEGSSNEQRPWAKVANEYVASQMGTRTSDGKEFVNILDSYRVIHYCHILETLVEFLEADDSIFNNDVIERAQILLDFLHTHEQDPYSIYTGMQAATRVALDCVKEAQPQVPPDFDLSRYITEVSRMTDDHQLAESVRFLSAKLRGVYNDIQVGTVVLVVLPGPTEHEDQLPSTIIQRGRTYQVQHSLSEFTASRESSPLHFAEGGSRVMFARCAVSPTQHNLVGLWFALEESTESIVWCSVSRVNLVKPEYLECAAHPLRAIDKLPDLVVPHEGLLNAHFGRQISAQLMSDLQEQLALSPEVFHRITTRSRTLFIDEEDELRLQASTEEMLLRLLHHESGAHQLVTSLRRLHREFLREFDPHAIFVFYRERYLRTLRESTVDDLTVLCQKAISLVKSESTSRLELLHMTRQKVLEGLRKKHITAWWLKETRRSVQTFMKELGYSYEAVGKDYTTTPPTNLALVEHNLHLLRMVLDKSSRHYMALLQMIEKLRQRVKPQMEDLKREMRAVILGQIQQPVTEESIQDFQASAIKSNINLCGAQMDPTVIKQIGGLLNDLEYLSMMDILEEQPDLRSQHPHIVPITGLVKSSIVRLQSECSTVMELWGHLKVESSRSDRSEEPAEPSEDDGAALDEQRRLHKACQGEGSLEEIKALLDKKTTPAKARDAQGNTALHYLVGRSLTTEKERILRKKLVKKMIESRVDVNCTNQSGETPLSWSLKQSDERLSYLLVKMKANPTIQSWSGESPITLLTAHPSPVIASALSKYHEGISPEIIARCGASPPTKQTAVSSQSAPNTRLSRTASFMGTQRQRQKRKSPLGVDF